MVCSMSRKGNCWDNAPTESWFNSFKNERVHGDALSRHATEMTAMTFEYIEVFYNRKRRHSTLGYKSPIQFLEDWLTTQHEGKTGSMKSHLLEDEKQREAQTSLLAWLSPLNVLSSESSLSIFKNSSRTSLSPFSGKGPFKSS